MKRYKVMMAAVLGIIVLLLSFAPMPAATTAPSCVAEEGAGGGIPVGTEVVLSNNTVTTYLGKTLNGNNEWQAIIGAPKYLDDLTTPIDCRWEYNIDTDEWNSGTNLFTATVKDSNVTVAYQGKKMQWQPQLEIGNKQQTDNGTALLPVDPINENYLGNTLQWDYGNGITRNLRIIEGMLIEYYTISELPAGNITIKTNTEKDTGFVWTRPASAWDNSTSLEPLDIMVDGNSLTLTREVMQNATLPITIDPDSTFNTSASDAFLYREDNWRDSRDVAWFTAHNANFADVVATECDTHSLGVGVDFFVSDTYGYLFQIYRAVVYFDTSGLPDDCNVTAATLKLYKHSLYTEFCPWILQVQNGTPPYPHDPPDSNGDDYYYARYSGNGGTISSSSMSGTGYRSITLTEAGKSWINKTGPTKFMLRDGTFDIPNGYQGETSGKSNVFCFYAYEKGASYRPQLVVTYETSPSPPAVSTNAATDIEYTSATLNGEITNTGGENCDKRGFDWGETTSYGSTWAESGSYGVGSFSLIIAGLDPDKTYHFRAKAHNSAGWGNGTDKEIPKRLSPLEKYAPVLYFHPNESYYTDSTYSMMNESNLTLWNESAGQGEVIGFSPTEADLASNNTIDHYMDIPNSQPYPFRVVGEWGAPPADPPEPSRFVDYNLTVYGRQVVKTYQGTDYVVLQYWFFYPYNKWYNCHEGDWERIQIICDKATQTPINVTFGHHEGGDTYNWVDAEVSFDAETHPKVFVGLGSHSSWPTDGKHLWGYDLTLANGTALFPEYIDNSGIGGVDKQPYKLKDISGEPSWVKWLGRWGQYVNETWRYLGACGVDSPANVVINGINVWDDPIAWAKDPGSEFELGIANSAVRLHAYDSNGNHTGLNETTGEIETEIPGTYFYIPAGNQSDEELMWIYTEENLTFTLEATGPGESNFSFARHFSDTVTINYTHIQVTQNTTARVDTGGGNPLLLMGLDFDSNGVTDAYKFPDSNSTLEGQVNFTGRDTPPNDSWIEPFNVTLFEPGNLSNVLWTGVATTNNTGVFTIDNIPPNTTYDIGIKNWTCLSELVTNVTVGVNETIEVDFGTTREGDANNDDWVTGADRALLYAAWGSREGDPNWNPHCDFNRDGWITASDRSLMYANWGQCGDLA